MAVDVGDIGTIIEEKKGVEIDLRRFVDIGYVGDLKAVSEEKRKER